MKKIIPFIVVVLTGCSASVPESRMGTVDKDVPLRWSATPEALAGIDTNWVRRLGGSRAEALVSEAFRRNPDMRVAAERVNRAIASAKSAGAPKYRVPKKPSY